MIWTQNLERFDWRAPVAGGFVSAVAHFSAGQESSGMNHKVAGGLGRGGREEGTEGKKEGEGGVMKGLWEGLHMASKVNGFQLQFVYSHPIRSAGCGGDVSKKKSAQGEIGLS